MIDIKNIKSIKVVKSNSPIHITDEMQDIKDEGIKQRNIYPNLTTIYNKW